MNNYPEGDGNDLRPAGDPPVYPNLPQTFPSTSKVASKTRRAFSKKDSEDCYRVLTQVFGYSKFKGKQKQIVEAAYCGADVLVVAPTGMGKSLCFQIPAVADKRGLSVVVSPLLALMQNQIENLRKKGVEVTSLSSQVPREEQEEISRHLQLYDIRLKLLYVTPERLCTSEFLELLDGVYENHNLNRLVVDEAHCISEWGHDFRAEYRRIGRFRERYPDVPIMALTATATVAVQKDIIKSLKLDQTHLFVALHPFNRENLFYEVKYLSNPEPLNQMADIFEYITTLYRRRGQASSGIVYCRARRTCDDLASYLRGKGLNAKPYHRGVPSATLEKTLQGWTAGTSGQPGGVDLVVATIAFGLGIDKGDVRYIIHYDMPKSFEGYYQETGRAGRDGLPSKCILYYSREDAIRVKNFVHNSNPNRVREEEDDGPSPTQRATGSLQALITFAESATLCRHVSICRYFDEPIDDTNEELVKTYCNRMCDICKNPDRTKARMLKLSSQDEARVNVPQRPMLTGNSNDGKSAFPNRFSGQLNNNLPSGGMYGAQKRPGTDFVEGSSKKPKVTSAPILVTKPFGSTSGLSKPFKPPSFVNKTGGSNRSNPPPPPPPVVQPPPNIVKPPTRKVKSAVRVPNTRVPEIRVDEDIFAHVEMEDEELSLELELPDLNLPWEPEQSTKVSVDHRREGFASLRRRLHSVFTLPLLNDDYWEKISERELGEDEKNEILFKVASELEQSAISLSSTLEGYNSRVGAIQNDIKALFNLKGWDEDNDDFEDSRDIIHCLRESSKILSRRKDKK